MPRYLVEQTFPDSLPIAADAAGAQLCLDIANNNAADGVTWLYSYVTPDKRKVFTICDAPTPEAIRRAAQRNNQLINRITEVRVLAPYFYM
jgi:hypothetical protein